MAAQGPFATEKAALEAIANDSGLSSKAVETLNRDANVGTLGSPAQPARWFDIQGTQTQYAISNPAKGIYWVWIGKVGQGLKLLPEPTTA